MRNCQHCNAYLRDIESQNRVNHILHLFISAFTLGVWGIVWALLSIKTTYICKKCELPSEFKNIVPIVYLCVVAVCVGLSILGHTVGRQQVKAKTHHVKNS